MSARQKVPSRQYYNSSCRSFPTPTAGDDGRTGTNPRCDRSGRMRPVHPMTANVDTTPTRPPFWWPLFSSCSRRGCCAGSFPTADPPWQSTVGIVWHDEGAWVHNARNMALFGAMGSGSLESCSMSHQSSPDSSTLSFAAFGVGLWQARLVSELSGLLAVALLACGMRRLAGRDAGLIAGVLLATNYIGVMWDRAALLEASMVAFVVAGVVLLRPRPDTAALGCARRRVRTARLFHQSGSGIFRRRHWRSK